MGSFRAEADAKGFTLSNNGNRKALGVFARVSLQEKHTFSGRETNGSVFVWLSKATAKIDRPKVMLAGPLKSQ